MDAQAVIDLLQSIALAVIATVQCLMSRRIHQLYLAVMASGRERDARPDRHC